MDDTIRSFGIFLLCVSVFILCIRKLKEHRDQHKQANANHKTIKEEELSQNLKLEQNLSNLIDTKIESIAKDEVDKYIEQRVTEEVKKYIDADKE